MKEWVYLLPFLPRAIMKNIFVNRRAYYIFNFTHWDRNWAIAVPLLCTSRMELAGLLATHGSIEKLENAK